MKIRGLLKSNEREMNGLNIIGLLDNWSAIAAIVGPIIGFMCTAMLWLRGYIKTYMKEMKAEHREDMKAMKEEMKEIHSHWREMFMYMNNKIDDTKK